MEENNTDYLDILIQIRQIVRSISLDSKRIEKQLGVTIPQLLLIRFLSKKEGYKASSTEIAEHLGLNLSTVTGIIRRMTEKGIVSKTSGPTDRRVRMVYLTAAGNDLLQNAPPTLHDKVSERLKKLNKGDRETLNKGMRLMLSILEAEKLDAAPMLLSGDIGS